MVGPKLLKALNNLAQFSLVREAGAVSPELLAEWVGEPGEATRCYEQAHRPPLALVNLCTSLTCSEGSVQRVEQFLTQYGACAGRAKWLKGCLTRASAHLLPVFPAESTPQTHRLAENP